MVSRPPESHPTGRPFKGSTWLRGSFGACSKCGLTVKSGRHEVQTACYLEFVRTNVWADSSPGDREGSRGRGNELR
jgi:hypothetical protein